MTDQKLMDYCLSKRYAALEYPFGPSTATFKAGGKVFTAIYEKDGVTKLTLKCEPMLADLLRKQYSAVKPADKSGHWNRVLCDGSVPDNEIFRQIDHSYDLILKSLTKKTRERLKRESHPLYLFPDPNYQPLEIREGDQYLANGIWIFNITRLLEHITTHHGEYPLKETLVADHTALPSKIPIDKCADADLRCPVILAEISPGRYNLIDGNKS
ncbi:MAG: MmcQ/YjbR family DNA-binding protein [Oscillospiraceae bacterium]|nr:MmcQ/YjbR family DNA-binding protein [Oscillospiraceae bacterium]